MVLTGSGNGLTSDSTKPSYELMLTCHEVLWHSPARATFMGNVQDIISENVWNLQPMRTDPINRKQAYILESNFSPWHVFSTSQATFDKSAHELPGPSVNIEILKKIFPIIKIGGLATRQSCLHNGDNYFGKKTFYIEMTPTACQSSQMYTQEKMSPDLLRSDQWVQSPLLCQEDPIKPIRKGIIISEDHRGPAQRGL